MLSLLPLLGLAANSLFYGLFFLTQRHWPVTGEPTLNSNVWFDEFNKAFFLLFLSSFLLAPLWLGAGLLLRQQRHAKGLWKMGVVYLLCLLACAAWSYSGVMV